MRRELSSAMTKTMRDFTVNEAAFTLPIGNLRSGDFSQAWVKHPTAYYMLRLPSPPDQFKVGNSTTHYPGKPNSVYDAFLA